MCFYDCFVGDLVGFGWWAVLFAFLFCGLLSVARCFCLVFWDWLGGGVLVWIRVSLFGWFDFLFGFDYCWFGGVCGLL